MRSILLTSNDDIINGLRLAGVRSVKCNNRSELLKILNLTPKKRV